MVIDMNSIDAVPSFHRIQAYGSETNSSLIQGENYRVLKALKKKFTNKIQCVYIDPPYNTCQSFPCFEDSVPQKKWLKTMKKRLILLRDFLSETGSIWISIDDNELAYLKVLCDEIFGKQNYISTIVRKKNKYPSSTERFIVHMHDYLLVYAKNANRVKFYNIPDNSMSENLGWTPINLLVKTTMLPSGSSKSDYIYEIETPFTGIISPPKGRCWRVTKNEYEMLLKDDKIWFDGNDPFPYEKKPLKDYMLFSPTTIWDSSLVDSNQTAREEISRYNGVEFFYVPKPERLIKTILEICTKQGDYVLDPYLGSGTTAVVASRMHRQWIGIEKEQYQCEQICLERLKDTILYKRIQEKERSMLSNVEWGFTYFKYNK